MYESFYGLKEKPFSLLPDPAYLYLSRQHGMAMSLLEYGLENHAGFCVVTGKAGTGKTTLLRQLLNRAGDDVTVGLITNTHHSFGELLRWILHAFSLPDSGKSRSERHQILIDYLILQYAKNKRTLLIVDEAQNLSPDALEELRMLSNVNSEKDILLQIILTGQPALREILRRPELKQFAQRISVDYHLDALGREQTQCYIRHRIVKAGGESELFTVDACEEIFEYSGGIPRLINTLCDFSLVYAYADHAAVVTGELVEQVIQERVANGALPIFAHAAKSPGRQGSVSISAQPSWAAKIAGEAVKQPNTGARDSRTATEVGDARVSINVNSAAVTASSRAGNPPELSRDGAALGNISNSIEREETRQKPATSDRSAGKSGDQSDRSAHHATHPPAKPMGHSPDPSGKVRRAKGVRASKKDTKARVVAVQHRAVRPPSWLKRYASVAAVVGLLSSAAFVWHLYVPQSGQAIMATIEGFLIPASSATPPDEPGSHAMALGDTSSAQDANGQSTTTDVTRRKDESK